jgi:hypothetical protein
MIEARWPNCGIAMQVGDWAAKGRKRRENGILQVVGNQPYPKPVKAGQG